MDFCFNRNNLSLPKLMDCKKISQWWYFIMQMYVLKQQKHKNVTYSEQENSLKVTENAIANLIIAYQ